jgi:uncharacterized membrane protein YqjE
MYIIITMWEKYWLHISILLLILGAYGAFVLIWRYVKSVRSAQVDKDSQIPFTLAQLRDMLNRGLIDQKEFDKLRKTIIDDCRINK